MKKKLFIMAGVLLATLTLASCDKNKDSATLYWSIATVENPDNSTSFRFLTDLGNDMKVVSSPYFGYRPDDGQRIFVQYFILSDEAGTEADYDHAVQLYDVYEILTKDIKEITAEDEEEIGNDPVYMSDIWLGGGYINFEFGFKWANKTHFINLVENMEEEYDDDKIHLEFRHNAYKDNHSRTVRSLASFSLDPLELPDGESTIVIHYRDYSSPDQEKTLELKYKSDQEAAANNKKYSRSDDNSYSLEIVK